MSDPTPGVAKTVGAALSGALSTLVIYAIEQFIGHPLPSEIVGAAQTLFTVGVVYLVPHQVGSGS